MSTRTEERAAATETAKDQLREWMPEGSTVRLVLVHVSRSGMLRVIRPVITTASDGYDIFPGRRIADVLDMRYDRDKDGIRVHGVGMDMGFHLVYELSYALYGDGYALKHRWL